MRGKVGLEEHFAIQETRENPRGTFAERTWAELKEAATKLTKKDAGGKVTQWGVQFPSSGFPYWLFQTLTTPNDAIDANEAGTAVKLWVGNLPKHGRYDVIKRLAWVLGVPPARLAKEVDERIEPRVDDRGAIAQRRGDIVRSAPDRAVVTAQVIGQKCPGCARLRQVLIEADVAAPNRRDRSRATHPAARA